jgi:hypothetical protein
LDLPNAFKFVQSHEEVELMVARNAERAEWRRNWQSVQTEHAKAAARALYPLGAAAAGQMRRIPYGEAATYLNISAMGYGGRRSLLPLDALAGLCATLDVPDLSSIFWSQETVELSELGSPDAHMPRWESIKDKEAEELRCHRNTSWPPASSV